jgi:hypothetical protein
MEARSSPIRHSAPGAGANSRSWRSSKSWSTLPSKRRTKRSCSNAESQQPWNAAAFNDEEMAGPTAAGPGQIHDTVSLLRRWSVGEERLAAPHEPSKWWRLVQAMDSMLKRQAPEKVEELKAIAEEGGPWAGHGMYRLGRMCDDGRGLKRDYGQAAEWYRKAAEAGNPLAMDRLGMVNRAADYPPSRRSGCR